jgi:hypothetical protein
MYEELTKNFTSTFQEICKNVEKTGVLLYGPTNRFHIITLQELNNNFASI